MVANDAQHPHRTLSGVSLLCAAATATSLGPITEAFTTPNKPLHIHQIPDQLCNYRHTTSFEMTAAPEAIALGTR